MEHGDVIAGIQVQQLLIGHAILFGDSGPHIAGLHGVYHGPGLGGVELLGNIAQVGDQRAVYIALLHLYILHEIAVHGALGDITHLHLLHQLLNGSGEGGGSHGLAVYIQGIAIGDVTDLGGEAPGKVLPALYLPAGDHMGLGRQQAPVDGVALVSQGLAGDGLQLLHRQIHGAAGADGAQVDAVVADGGAHGVHRQQHDHRRSADAGAQENGRVQTHTLPQGADAAAAADAVLAAHGKLLPQARAYPGKAAPGKQQQLSQAAFGLRKFPALFLLGQTTQPLPGAAQGRNDMALYGGLNIQIQPVRILLGVPDPVLQILPPQLPDIPALLRRYVDVVDVFMHQVLFHNKGTPKKLQIRYKNI